MADYIIATSSTSDLPRTWLEEHRIPFIAYSSTVNDTTVCTDDCREESRAKVYEGMRRGDVLKTSMINEFTYYEFFKSLVEQGKDVIFLDMSREMSASYQNAQTAAERIRKDFPDRQFYMMDTRCISGGLGMLVESMVEQRAAGLDYEAAIAWGEAHKLNIAHRFTVNDLKYLKAGGRVSNASALVGTILNIKPVLYVPDRGTLDVAKKVRGRKAALQTILEGTVRDLKEAAPGGQVHILQADCREDAAFVRDEIRKAVPGIGEITITALGVVIGAHCGPGLLTVFYYCGGRRAL
jgi:DegV family protein with EDD domain